MCAASLKERARGPMPTIFAVRQRAWEQWTRAEPFSDKLARLEKEVKALRTRMERASRSPPPSAGRGTRAVREAGAAPRGECGGAWRRAPQQPTLLPVVEC